MWPLRPRPAPLVAQRLQQAAGEWRLAGDPTEGALVTLAMKAGLDPAYEKSAYPRVDVIPFESEHRFMASLHHDHRGARRIFLKGAPERVLALCEAGARGVLDRVVAERR